MQIYLWERYLEIEWLLSWFPISANSPLTVPQHRGNRYVLKSSDPGLGANQAIVFSVGNGVKGDGDPLPNPPRVVGFATVGLDANGYFQVGLELQVGGAIRKTNVPLLQGGATPFMLNVHARGDDPVVGGTAGTLQGVFTTGPRAGLLQVIARAIAP